MQDKLNTVNAEAARKMAIVDAMTPEQRAKVWDIGLNAFSRAYPTAYKTAKKKAGIKGACHFTQTKSVSKALAA